MIHIENLVKHYGSVRALDGLSLHVDPGVVYGFLGPNGAGKTTTLRILSGLARPDQGRIQIMGKTLPQPSLDIHTALGVLPEEPAFYPWMTPTEYLRDFVAPLYGLDAQAAARRAAELLAELGLQEAADRRIGGFSRGMRQRLGLAQTLVHQPPILLLDEPVSALDPAGRKDILELIDRLRGKTTILFSTHILADVERVCDVVGIINKGCLVIQSPREDLLARYVQPLLEIELEADPSAWIRAIQPLPQVVTVTVANHTVRLLVKEVAEAQKQLLAALLAAGLTVRRFEIVQPSLEDIFLRLTSTPEPS